VRLDRAFSITYKLKQKIYKNKSVKEYLKNKSKRSKGIRLNLIFQDKKISFCEGKN
jgi:hypothetical protein